MPPKPISEVIFIPARSGSKRLRDKNIRLLYGRLSLTEWAVCTAVKYAKHRAARVGNLPLVVFNSDSEEYINKVDVLNLDAVITQFRDAKLADDTTPTLDVILDSVKRLDLDYFAEKVNCLLWQTTNPFRRYETITNLLDRSTSDKMSAVTTKELPTITKDGIVNLRTVTGNGYVFPFEKQSNQLTASFSGLEIQHCEISHPFEAVDIDVFADLAHARWVADYATTRNTERFILP